MKTQFVPLLTVVAVAALASCAKNPADEVEKAEVTDVTEATTTSGGAEGATTYTLTPDSKLEFVGSKVTGSHTGGFTEFTGSFQVDVPNKALAEDGEHVVKIDMDSTYSDSDKLTGHLKSADFFEVETYPTSTFVLTKAVKEADGAYTLSGTLDLHGVKKSIAFPAKVTVADDNSTVNVKAEFAINRMDFGIEYPGKPDDLIRKEVVIKFDVTAKAST